MLIVVHFGWGFNASVNFYFIFFFKDQESEFINFQSTSGPNQNWLVSQFWPGGRKSAITALDIQEDLTIRLRTTLQLPLRFS